MKLVVREARPQDGAAVAAVYRPYVLETPVSFEEQPPDAQEMTNRITEITKKYPYLIAELDGRVIGYAYGTKFHARASYRWSVEIAIYLEQSCRRRGIGRTLCNRLLPLLTAQGFAVAYAGITLPNPFSTGLFEALGFTRVALFHGCGFKFGAWHDVGTWELPLRERVGAPPEPISWPDMPRFEPELYSID